MSSPPLEHRSIRTWRELFVASALLLALLLLTLPASPWEFDELMFAEGVRSYNPLNHHPPPPGYPLYMALAKLIALVVRNPYSSLVVLSVISSLVAFVSLSVAAAQILNDRTSGLMAAAILYLSPVMLIHSNLAFSDNPGLALLAISLLLAGRVDSRSGRLDGVLFALAASATVGVRPQLSVSVLPLLLVVLAQIRGRRKRTLMLSCFTLACLCWLFPMVAATGGPGQFLEFELGQARTFSAHDAVQSRTGYTLGQVAVRFIAHPWGPKWLSIPVLLLATLGMHRIIRSIRLRQVWPLAGATIPYLVFAILTMDPADAPRYSIPATMGVAIFAGAGIKRVSELAKEAAVGPLIVMAYAAGSFLYAGPFLVQRSSEPSPPVQAAEWADTHLPAGAVVLYDLSLKPHAEYLFRSFDVMRLDEGLARTAAAPGVPVYLLADGLSSRRGGMRFSWDDSDVYGKITRNHYRVVSLIRLPPDQRFVPRRGIWPFERDADGEEWQWLSSTAELALPPMNRAMAHLELALPRFSPISSNALTVYANGERAARKTISRGERTSMRVPLAEGWNVIRIESSSSFVPAAERGTSRDPRRLAVALLAIEQEGVR